MTNATVNPSEVGWQFVPQYYTFVNKQPNRLHCFYTKASTFIHGTEGEDGKPCYGQQVRLVPSSDASYIPTVRSRSPFLRRVPIGTVLSVFCSEKESLKSPPISHASSPLPA